MTKSELKDLIREVIIEQRMELDNNQLDEGVKDIAATMAMLALTIFIGAKSYDNYKLREKWTQAYEEIEQSDPEKADKIKELINTYRYSRPQIFYKRFGRNFNTRSEIEQEIQNILDDVESNKIQ